MNIFCRHQSNRVLNTSANIFNSQVRVVVLTYFLKRQPFIKKFENALYGNARAGYTGFSKMYLGIDADSFCHLFTSQKQKLPV